MIVELNVNTNRPAALAPVLCDTLSSIPFLFMIERAWPTHHLHCNDGAILILKSLEFHSIVCQANWLPYVCSLFNGYQFGAISI